MSNGTYGTHGTFTGSDGFSLPPSDWFPRPAPSAYFLCDGTQIGFLGVGILGGPYSPVKRHGRVTAVRREPGLGMVRRDE